MSALAGGKTCRAGHVRTSEFLANAALFQCAVLGYNLLKWMAILVGGGDPTVANKDDAAVVSAGNG